MSSTVFDNGPQQLKDVTVIYQLLSYCGFVLGKVIPRETIQPNFGFLSPQHGE